jgi:hypothetical protein
MWICPKCKAENENIVDRCSVCGESLTAQENILTDGTQHKANRLSVPLVIRLLFFGFFVLGVFSESYFKITFYLFAFVLLASLSVLQKKQVQTMTTGRLYARPVRKSFVFAGVCYTSFLSMALFFAFSMNIVIGALLIFVGFIFGIVVSNLYDAILEEQKKEAMDGRQIISNAVGVPKRFSVGTFMIITTMFCVLFAVMKIIGANAIIFGIVATFFLGIGLSQMFLFNAKLPRQASIVGGFFLGLIVGLIGIIVTVWAKNNQYDMRFDEYNNSLTCAFGIMLLGGPLGYLAGCVTAGIFLVREKESTAEVENNFDSPDEEL